MAEARHGEDALARRIAAARAHVQPAWDEGRAAHLVERAAARIRRERIARVTSFAVVAIAAGALVAYGTGGAGLGVGTGAVPPVLAGVTSGANATIAPAPAAGGTVGRADGSVHFADGSVAVPLDPGTELVIDAVTPGAVAVELAAGGARFEVTPGLPRAFSVRAGHVEITVVGTIFSVHLAPSGIVEVSVDEGTVRVRDGARESLLHAGESGRFDPRTSARIEDRPAPSAAIEGASASIEGAAIEEAAIEGARRVEGRVTPRPSRSLEAPSPAAPAIDEAPTPALPPAGGSIEEPPLDEVRPAWRALADDGRFEEGYALLLADRDALRSDDVELLLLAADCARLSGHPAESLAYLHRAEIVGVGDPREATVAFTLGRVLLSQLRRPEEAAAAFARARELAPSGTLASDALAREVEAWARSGAVDRARARAEEYLSRYPDGVHTEAVRHHGGLD